VHNALLALLCQAVKLEKYLLMGDRIPNLGYQETIE
jgi:hypothetical protein